MSAIRGVLKYGWNQLYNFLHIYYATTKCYTFLSRTTCHIYTGTRHKELEDLKRSPDITNNVKIGLCCYSPALKGGYIGFGLSVIPSVIIVLFPHNILRTHRIIQILYVHWYWHDLALDCYVIFPKFVLELWPLINAKISFPLNILRTNFAKIYICIAT